MDSIMGVALEDHLVGLAPPGAIAGQEIRRAFAAVPPADVRRHELAVIAEADAVLDRLVPEEARRRIGERVVLVLAHAVRVAARPAREGTLEVIGAEGAGAPLVAVGAEDAGAIGVVEDHELADELVLVRSDAFAKDAKARVAPALGQRAEDLVVGPVLLDDVDDVLDEARLADALGDGAGGWWGRAGKRASAMRARRRLS
ncbi:MAG: hypothetical protein M5U12_35175 [Verrucomicrobia bacterium]|nr:hypothetical protein [Verrucomicrobiota bacterium]